jgi:predicted anti-sigma-YlaC factor YlaD
MSALGARARRCDRAREWISLELDGELSEFERIVLEAHAARCDDCRTFRLELRGISGELRAAPLERLGRAVVLPRRPARSRRAIQFAAAAAAAVAVGAGSTIGVITADRQGRGVSTRPAYLDSAQYEMKLVQRTLNARLLAAIAHAN